MVIISIQKRLTKASFFTLTLYHLFIKLIIIISLEKILIYIFINVKNQHHTPNCFYPAFCFPNGCATTVNVWQEFATGTTVTPPGTYPLQVVDGYGTALVINSLASLSPCSVTCTLAASATHNNTTCGANNGSVAVVPTGGTPTGYAWSNSGTTATISNVPAGTYTVTVTAGGCTATALRRARWSGVGR